MREYIRKFVNSSSNPVYNTIFRWMWRLALGGVAAIILLFIALSFTDLPSVEQLENPKSELASEIFSANGEVLGRYYTENRVPVSFNELSPNLVNSLIATEDERFYEHCGIDFPALGRVAFKTVLLGQRSSGGASTITQQLAKLLFTGQRASSMSRRAFQKLKEWIIAVRLERKYTKEEIIAMYLNKFNFINGAYGIKAASEIYFGKSQDSLALQEAAMLIGMLKNPSLFNPLRRPDTVLHRRMVVLKQMQKNGLITAEEYQAMKDLPLGLDFRRQTHVDGLAPYFRMELAKYIKDILRRPEYLRSDGEPYDIYRDGLRVYTTIDANMQRIAEEEMVENMKRVQKTFWRTWRNMDPWTYRSNSPNEISLEVRKQRLEQLIRESDRYQSLRSAYLSDIIAAIEKDFPDIIFHTDDREIRRMMAEHQKEGTLSQLVSRDIISSRYAAKYRKIMNSRHFSTLKTKWEKLQQEVEQAFKTPAEMRVFAYNDQMETDTTMTPLDSIKYHRMFLQTGVLAVEPHSGHVKVWIGGINHKYFQYDHIETPRQVGSTFKPFVYGTAIDKQGFSPCYQVYDLPVTIGPGDGNFHLAESWTPKNADGVYTGELLTLKDGLRKSKNTVSAHLMKQLRDTEPIIDLLDRMGISKEDKYPNGQYRVPRQPSICLGATDLTVMEMTGAYTTFANNGVFNKPVFITRIEDQYGNKIFEEMPDERPAIAPNANYVMVQMLQYAATGLGNLKSQVGGKTGTTNDYVDGWFMGVTPNLVVGTWVGGEDRWIRFRALLYGQGAYMAKPFFKNFVKRLEDSPEVDYDVKARFYRPPGDLGIELDCSEYRHNDLQLDDGDEFGEDFSEDMFGDEAIQPADDQVIEEDQEDN